MALLSGLVLALALSVDGMIVGIQYGMRQVRIPTGSLVVIGLCTAVGMSSSMLAGRLFAADVSHETATTIGGLTLVALGLWQLSQGSAEYLRRLGREAWRRGEGGEYPELAFIRIPAMGVIVKIVADPLEADTDRSGSIDLKEALALGIALGLDTLAAGFAASMLGFRPWLIVLVAAAILLLVRLGVALGRRLDHRLPGNKWLLVPGLVILVTGIAHL